MDRITIHNAGEQGRSTFWDNFVHPLLRYKRISMTIVTTTLVVTLIYCLLVSNLYTSYASLLPSSGTSQLSELKDLAAGSLGELGLGTFSQAAEYSSALYPHILNSRRISEQILKRRYDFVNKSENFSMTLEEYIDAANFDLSLKELKEITSVSLDRRTGVTTLSVTTKYPQLSAIVVEAYLETLDDYNVHHRQSRAAENEKFIASRLVEIEEELKAAEDSLLGFQQRNRDYASTTNPEVKLELARRVRTAKVKSSLYAMMVREYETARVEAAKDIPIIRVLDGGAVPIVKSKPRRSLYMIAAFFVSILFSIFLSLWLDLSARRGVARRMREIASSSQLPMSNFEKRTVNRIAGLVESLNQSQRNRQD